MPTIKYKTATREEVLNWLEKELFTVTTDDNGTTKVYKGDRELTQRINSRNRMEGGDPRVDLYVAGLTKAVNVSHLVWMVHYNQVIPAGFEVHHVDEEPTNNRIDNLVCVFGNDHHKLHKVYTTYEDDLPF